MEGTRNLPELFEEEMDPCLESLHSTGQVVFVTNHCPIKII
jgi:hypothetical protein